MKRLGVKAFGRKVFGNNEGFEIHEQAVPIGLILPLKVAVYASKTFNFGT